MFTLKMKKWSSQWTQFMQLCKEAWKKFRTSTGFEPETSRSPVWCSTNWAMKPLTLGAGQLWVHKFPWKKWVLMIYEMYIYIYIYIINNVYLVCLPVYESAVWVCRTLLIFLSLIFSTKMLGPSRKAGGHFYNVGKVSGKYCFHTIIH